MKRFPYLWGEGAVTGSQLSSRETNTEAWVYTALTQQTLAMKCPPFPSRYLPPNKTKTDCVPGMKVLSYDKSLLTTLSGRGGQGKVNGILLKDLGEPLAPAFRPSCLTFAHPSTSEVKDGLKAKQMNLES